MLPIRAHVVLIASAWILSLVLFGACPTGHHKKRPHFAAFFCGVPTTENQ